MISQGDYHPVTPSLKARLIAYLLHRKGRKLNSPLKSGLLFICWHFHAHVVGVSGILRSDVPNLGPEWVEAN